MSAFFINSLSLLYPKGFWFRKDGDIKNGSNKGNLVKNIKNDINYYSQRQTTKVAGIRV